MAGIAFPVMNGDVMDELPAESRVEVVAEIRSVLGVDAATAEDLVRSAEPLWNAMERAGGLVDPWGGRVLLGVSASALVHPHDRERRLGEREPAICACFVAARRAK
jgi:hypothetical protein